MQPPIYKAIEPKTGKRQKLIIDSSVSLYASAILTASSELVISTTTSEGSVRFQFSDQIIRFKGFFFFY